MKKTFLVLSAFLLATVAYLCCFLGFSYPVAAVENWSVVLDAGHGGIDSGVLGKRTKQKESDLNLAIVMLIREKLVEAGFKVVLTRKTEGGLYTTTKKGFKKEDMKKRKEIIDRENPLLTVSIHQNQYPSGSVRGGQVFFEKGDEESEAVAEILQGKLNEYYVGKGAKERVHKTGDYYMLRCSSTPSVIVECGFLSSEQDEKLLCSALGRSEIATAISSGILEYLTLRAKAA